MGRRLLPGVPGPHKGKTVDGDMDGITHTVCCKDRKHTLKRVDRPGSGVIWPCFIS